MRYIWCAAALAVTSCNTETEITQSPDDAPPAELRADTRYRVTKLTATFGGMVSVGTSINHRGWVAGFSNEPGDSTRHAALWRDGKVTDLRTLGGPNSLVQWPGLNDRGMVVGIAETGERDSLNESWSCSPFFPGGRRTGHVCRGFFWEGGVMVPLPTWGGTHGFATGINNRGQAVGWAETRVRDSTCNAPQVLQFRAAVWEPKRGRMTELRPIPGNSTSAATAINERGQVVGISGDCDVAVGRASARHAVLWDRGRPQEIPNLGGAGWHTPMDINERGDVTGFSNPEADSAGSFIRAFLWTRRGGLEDLGKFEGHTFSQAFGINDYRQVVGRSCGPSGCRAAIWHHGKMTDLNELIEPGFDGVLTAARHINDAGVITGNFVETSTGKNLPYIATPVRSDDSASDD